MQCTDACGSINSALAVNGLMMRATSDCEEHYCLGGKRRRSGDESGASRFPC